MAKRLVDQFVTLLKYDDSVTGMADILKMSVYHSAVL